MKEFLDIVKPSKAIFVKYEFWFNYLTELKKRNIPTYIISAIFRPSQYFFKWYGSFFRQMLNCYSLLFVQDKQSVELLNSIGIKDNVVLSGDTRFDRVNKIASTSKDFPQIEKFTNDKFSIVAGSTWMPDNELLASVVKNFSKIKLIIVPHEISEEGTTKIKTLFNDSNVIVMSELDDTTPLDVYVKADVLIIDKYGLLSSVYKYASMAYIGGGFGTGIHNTLEAATYSIPVVFGPNYFKIKESIDHIQ